MGILGRAAIQTCGAIPHYPVSDQSISLTFRGSFAGYATGTITYKPDGTEVVEEGSNYEEREKFIRFALVNSQFDCGGYRLGECFHTFQKTFKGNNIVVRVFDTRAKVTVTPFPNEQVGTTPLAYIFFRNTFIRRPLDGQESYSAYSGRPVAVMDNSSNNRVVPIYSTHSYVDITPTYDQEDRKDDEWFEAARSQLLVEPTSQMSVEPTRKCTIL